MSEEQINIWIERGFSRWTKGDMDRLYLTRKSSYVIGLEQHPCSGYWYLDSCRISAARAEEMLAAKTYIDVKTGKAHSNNKACWWRLNDVLQSEAAEASEE